MAYRFSLTALGEDTIAIYTPDERIELAEFILPDKESEYIENEKLNFRISLINGISGEESAIYIWYVLNECNIHPSLRDILKHMLKWAEIRPDGIWKMEIL